MQSDTGSRRWTRREFVLGAAGMVALQQLHQSPAEAELQQSAFAYVASGEGSLHVFSLRNGVWSRIQRVPSRAPACILLSPAQRTLYVANDVDVHEGLPRGTVEAFDIDPGNGWLTLLGRQPLSLSATHPRHMACPRMEAACRSGLRRRSLQPASDCGGRQPWPSEQHL